MSARGKSDDGAGDHHDPFGLLDRGRGRVVKVSPGDVLNRRLQVAFHIY